jgi:DNA-binding PadR family transcriptional regulator
LKAADMLSIDNDKLSLQKKVVELTEKSREENYAIKGKMQERDDQIQNLMRKQEEMERKFKMTLSKIDVGRLP